MYFINSHFNAINNVSSRSGGAVVEEFVYLGSVFHSSTQSSPDISRRNAINCACGYAKSRQTDLEVKNHHSNQAKVV